MNRNQREATQPRRLESKPRVVPSVSRPTELTGSIDATCDHLWRIQDVASFLDVPVATIYQWRVRHEGPPAIKLRKHLRFDPRQVREWAGALSEDRHGSSD